MVLVQQIGITTQFQTVEIDSFIGNNLLSGNDGYNCLRLDCVKIKQSLKSHAL